MKSMNRTGAVMRIFGLGMVAALAVPSFSEAAAGACLTYDSPVTLEGTLALETFAGPPNYDSVEKGDRPETVLLLRLKQPICMEAAADGMSDAVEGVAKVQLILRADKQFAEIKTLADRPVRLSGSLLGAQTGHHHTPVLLQQVVLVPTD